MRKSVYHEKARKWLFDYGGSNGFSVGTCNQLAEWMRKADVYDERQKAKSQPEDCPEIRGSMIVRG